MLSAWVCSLLLMAPDPQAAYEKKAYDQALQGYLDLQVSHPDDPALMLNVGSTYYQLKDYPQAEKAFAQAEKAAGENVDLKQAAAYDLGNAAFKQGKLEEAVQHYRESLALNSNDVHARHNLQLAEREMQRRRQEAQKQQQQNPQQQQQQDQQQEQQGEKNPQQKDGDNAQQRQDDSGGAQEQHGDNKPKPAPGDQDKPKPEPGQGEDKSTADKKAEPRGGHPADKPPDGKPPGAAPGKPGQTLTPEQAERYLQSVGDSRPKRRVQRGQPVQRMPNGKDW